MAQSINPYQAPKSMAKEAAVETQPVRLFAVSGRIGRVRYIAYGILVYLVIMFFAGLSAAVFGELVGGIAVIAAFIFVTVIGVMLTIQRCHDFNTTGWLSLLALVPLVNLIFLFIPGTDGPNDYGPPTPPNGVGVIVGALVLPLVFVVGVLAAVAIPAYGDYTHRARVAELLALSSTWRTRIAEHYIETRRLPASMYELKSPPPAETRYGKVSLAGQGTVVLTMGKEMGRAAEKTILIRPRVVGDNLEWDCTGGSLDRKYRPAMCRGQ